MPPRSGRAEPARISSASWPEQLRALDEDVGPVADILDGFSGEFLSVSLAQLAGQPAGLIRCKLHSRLPPIADCPLLRSGELLPLRNASRTCYR